MVSDLHMSGKLDTIMDISPTTMESDNSVKLPEEKMMICTNNCEDSAFVDDATEVPEEKLMMTCANNSEDHTFHTEVSPTGHDSIMANKRNDVDVEVNIIDNVDSDKERVVETGPQDMTESSSSFGCSEDSWNGSAAVSSDMEVESQIQDNNTSLLGFDGCDLFRTRKKKLTDHWRKFIRPLMWRCKWVEMQIRELHSQACKYDRELTECEKRKQSQFEKCATEELGMRSAPFISQNRSVKLMKRKKRKRVEDTVDIASYTSCHNLFSYYENERPITFSAYMGDDHDNTDVAPAQNNPFGNDGFDINVEWSKDRNGIENVLRTIEEVRLHIHQLRARMDKVDKEHGGKFTSNSSFGLGDQSARCAPSSVLLHVNSEKNPSGSVLTTSQQTSEKKLAMPESAVLSCGGTTSEQTQTGGKGVKMELDNTEEVGDQHNAESQLATKGKAGNVQHFPDPCNSAGKMPVNQEQPSVKIRSIAKLIIPNNKRKRGRRKARSGRWNRRSSS